MIVHGHIGRCLAIRLISGAVLLSVGVLMALPTDDRPAPAHRGGLVPRPASPPLEEPAPAVPANPEPIQTIPPRVLGWILGA